MIKVANSVEGDPINKSGDGEFSLRYGQEMKFEKSTGMAEVSVEIHFNSVAEFEAVYRFVSEEVLLFDSCSGTILAANHSFKNKGIAHNPELKLREMEGFPFAEDGCYEQPLTGKNELFSGCVFETTSVKLAGNPVKMGCLRLADFGSMEERLQFEQAEKKALLNEVYHRVKNNLNIIVSLLSLQLNRVSDPNTRHLLLESKSRIYTLSLLQQKLYSSPRISEIKAGGYLQSLSQSILSTFNPPEKNIRLSMEVGEDWLSIDTLVPLGLITHELLTNSVLHAFPDQKLGEVKVSFNRLDVDHFSLTIADNGRGIADNRKPEDFNSLGFQLVRNLIKQLKAEWIFESSYKGGTRITIKFKEILK